MERKQQTQAVILKRLDYAEADRIVTAMTPDFGKIGFIAKGTRRPKSKLAAGIELFSLNDITIIKGRGDLDTLISARPQQSFRAILRDYEVVESGYRILQLVQRGGEIEEARELFDLLISALSLLDEAKLDHQVVEAWFIMQFVQLMGSSPNLTTDDSNKALKDDLKYQFVVEDGVFAVYEQGLFAADQLKAWRVLLTADAKSLKKVRGLSEALAPTMEQLRSFANYIH